MTKFILGVLVGLAIRQVPWYRVLRDAPETPEGWKPKYRRWENGVLTEGSWK